MGAKGTAPRRLLGAAIAVLFVGTLAMAKAPIALAEPAGSPGGAACPYKTTTPPAVDASEVPKPRPGAAVANADTGQAGRR